jgi:hypothetical protein
LDLDYGGEQNAQQRFSRASRQEVVRKVAQVVKKRSAQFWQRTGHPPDFPASATKSGATSEREATRYAPIGHKKRSGFLDQETFPATSNRNTTASTASYD